MKINTNEKKVSFTTEEEETKLPLVPVISLSSVEILFHIIYTKILTRPDSNQESNDDDN